MADTAAGILVDAIHDWGIDIIFGLPGDGINGIIEALRTRQDKVRFVQVRHEEAAAFMACCAPSRMCSWAVAGGSARAEWRLRPLSASQPASASTAGGS